MHRPHDVETIIREGSAVDRAIVVARSHVIERHRQLRVPLVIWREGRIVEVAPDAVPLPELPRAKATGAH